MKSTNMAIRASNFQKPQKQEESISINRVMPSVSPVSTPVSTSGFIKPAPASAFEFEELDFNVPKNIAEQKIESASNFNKLIAEVKAPENGFAIASGNKLALKGKDGQKRLEKFLSALNQDYEDIDESMDLHKSTEKDRTINDKEKEVEMEIDQPEEGQQTHNESIVKDNDEKEIRLESKSSHRDETNIMRKTDFIQEEILNELDLNKDQTDRIDEAQNETQEYLKSTTLPNCISSPITHDPSKKIFSLQTHLMPTPTVPISIFSEIEK